MQPKEGSPQSKGLASGRLENRRGVGVSNDAPAETRSEVAKNPRFRQLRSVELFAGIGGFRLAADARGIRTIWANDKSPSACSVYRRRFGDKELREGNLDWFLSEIPDHELLTAGFPCQPFSSAGKKKGIRDPRGTLFQRIIDVLQKQQPTYFILENVKRLLTMEDGLHFATILSSLSDLHYFIEWRLINAMHLGLPQNRQRVFLIGVHNRASGPPKSLFSEELRVHLANMDELKSLPLDVRASLGHASSWKPIEKHGLRFPTWGMASKGHFVAADLDWRSAAAPVLLRDVLEGEVGAEFDFTESTLQWLPSNTPVDRFIQGVEILSNQGGGARMGYTIFGINGVAPTLTSTTSRHYERYKIGDRYRRLTNIEYARIQGFPDGHCKAASVYEQYALIGNAVPPPMVSWVLDRLIADAVGAENLTIEEGPLDLFSHAYQRTIASSVAKEPARHRRQGERGSRRKARETA